MTRQTSDRTSTLIGERELEMTRTFEAPRALVFRAFAEPELLAQWWGPQDWNTTIHAFEFRPGGRWHYLMTGPENMESWGIAVFREITAPERILYTDAFSDAQASVIPPEMEISVTFEAAAANRTRLVTRTTFATGGDRDEVVAMGVEEGMNSSNDRLEALLARLQAA
jgi:uncharacterized protein YndB with AHSA1/START domain